MGKLELVCMKQQFMMIDYLKMTVNTPCMVNMYCELALLVYKSLHVLSGCRTKNKLVTWSCSFEPKFVSCRSNSLFNGLVFVNFGFCVWREK